MKFPALSLAVLLGAGVMSAQSTPTTPAAPAAPATPAPATPATPTTPATPAAKKDAKKKKEDEMGTITGITIPRANGTFLGLEVVGGNWKLSFYTKKKKPMAPDVARGTATWPNNRSVLGPNRTVLNPSGNALVGSKPVLPPYTFIVRLVLIQGEGDDSKAVENYAITLSGPPN